MAHHTKDKGDLGVAKALADLEAQGFLVLLPLTEHAAFDLVAYRDSRFERVQVKYRTEKNGGVTVAFNATWSDTHGVHKRPVDKSQIDVVCIYCPETDECYYVRPSVHRDSVKLRTSASRNNQRLHVLFASAYRLMPLPLALSEVRTCP